MKQYWKVGAVAVLLLILGGAAAGIITAQEPTGTSTPKSTATDEASTPEATDEKPDATKENDGDVDKGALRDQFLGRLAANLNISVDDLKAALRQTGNDLLDQAVADGRISEDEAARIRARIESGDFPLVGFGFEHHRGGPGGPGCGVELDATADFLGMQPADLRSALEGGQSLAQVAEDHGKSRDDLINFLVGQVTDRVNEAVANGRIEQDRADELIANAKVRIGELVDHEGLPGPKYRHHDEQNDGTPDETEASLRL